jgi:gliding motility-associated-like protein
MTKRIHFKFKLSLAYFIVIFLLLFSATKTNAQCAGNDVSITVCDIPDPSSQSIDLFSYLVGASPGGTWTDDNFSDGLNLATGILNAQLISRSGVYNYTYTAPAVSGCIDNTAIVTVTVGGYSGVTGPNASVCGDTSQFNLFQVFNGNTLPPQANGTWFNVTNNVSVGGSTIQPDSTPIGTYQFTYTIPAIGTCPATSSTAFVTIFKPADSGLSKNLLLCESDDMSLLTNFDLNSLLIGEDSGGTWTESAVTDELTSNSDRFVNVQNIYNTLGVGNYSFTYTVIPNNRVCPIKFSTVNIIIEKRYDFTGGSLVVNSDICEDKIKTATYNVILKQGTQVIPDGKVFEVFYRVTGANGGNNSAIVTFSNGQVTFPISSEYFQTVGISYVSLTNIVDVNSMGACRNIFNLEDDLIIYPLPKLTSTALSIADVCKGFNAQIDLNGNPDLLDGNYTITYNLSGDNVSSFNTAIIEVVGGNTNFIVPSSLIPNVGNTKITIVEIVNNVTGCKNTADVMGNIKVEPLPDPANLAVVITDYCKDVDVEVKIAGLGILTDVFVQYNITGVNPLTSQTIPLSVINGSTSFIIPASSFPNIGASTFTITRITNAITGCTIVVNVNDVFEINDIPLPPSAQDQSFCETEKATVGNLVPNDVKYKWYNSITATTPLANNLDLVTGDYFVKEVNVLTGCESPFTGIKVVINKIASPTLNPSGELFCGLDKPTLQELSNNTSSPSNIIWYDALTGGNLLPDTTLLQEGITYYGYNTSSANNCQSIDVLKVTVTLTNCPEDPLVYDFFIPDAFSPNGDGQNDAFRIPKIDFLFPNYSIDIYNRYGNIIFSGNKNRPEWDGKTDSGSTGGIAPNGVYYYVINFNKDNKAPLQGKLYLNR